MKSGIINKKKNLNLGKKDLNILFKKRSSKLNAYTTKIIEDIINDSNSDINELIEIILEKQRNNDFISVSELCKYLNIDGNKLYELLEHEHIIFKLKSDPQNIKAEEFERFIQHVHHIQNEKLQKRKNRANIRDLIINSEPLLAILDSDTDYVRLSKFASMFNMSIQSVCDLFKRKGIILKCDHNTKVSCDLLRHLLLNELEINNSVSSTQEISNLVSSPVIDTSISINENLKDLKNKIQNVEQTVYSKSVVLNQFIRNEYIKQYAKLRAKGKCELCDNPGPFLDISGAPFLETHHVTFLSKGGADTIDNVVALCPNCHRKIHNLNLDSDIKKLLGKLEVYTMN